MSQRNGMTSLSEPFQTYSDLAINGSASAQEHDQNRCSGPAESSRKRGCRSEVDGGRGSSDFSWKRMSSSPYPAADLLLSLGNKVPDEAAGVEVSMKALEGHAAVQVGESGLGSLNGSSLRHARSLNPGQHNELIARLLAAASASSRDQNSIFLQAIPDPFQAPILAQLPQGQPYIEPGVNRGLTRVNSGINLHHPQGVSTLNDHNLINTTLIKPLNTMSSDALIKSYPYYNINIIENSNINTSDALMKPNYPYYNSNTIENNNMREAHYGATSERKVAMQRHVMVVMEGRSIERTLCLHDYDSYESFAKALSEMFNNGTHHNHLMSSSIPPSNSYTPTLHNAIPGYKIAYQDYEGDLLLAGDIPWREFITVAKQIKILPVIKPKHIHCLDEP